MSERQESAASDFANGFNCSQSVLCAFCEKYGLSREEALKIVCGLGGGFRCGEVCGAVSGAVIVIGLKYGHYIAGDMESKNNCNSKTKEFISLFKEKHNSIICRDILGIDISTDEGRELARSKNLFRTVCVDMVKGAVSLLEDLGY